MVGCRNIGEGGCNSRLCDLSTIEVGPSRMSILEVRKSVLVEHIADDVVAGTPGCREVPREYNGRCVGRDCERVPQIRVRVYGGSRVDDGDRAWLRGIDRVTVNFWLGRRRHDPVPVRR